MVVGQEWGDVASFVRQRGLDNPSATNKTLRSLLAGVGIGIDEAPHTSASSPVFLTNAVLCLKECGAQAPVVNAWFTNCQAFLRRQIELVQPRVVVTLGQRACVSVREEFALRPLMSFRRAARGHEVFELFNGVSLVPVYHCGNRVLHTHRCLEQQHEDWVRIKGLLATAATTLEQT